MVLRRADGSLLCERCQVADSFLTRLRGLLGRRSLADDECLFIRPAGSIHTFFMRFPIDAVFVDKDLRVVGITSDLRPWRTAGRRGAHSVVEMPAGTAQTRGLQAGEQLLLAAE